MFSLLFYFSVFIFSLFFVGSIFIFVLGVSQWVPMNVFIWMVVIIHGTNPIHPTLEYIGSSWFLLLMCFVLVWWLIDSGGNSTIANRRHRASLD